MDGDLERVKSLLQKGTDPNLRDKAGYTALVSFLLRCLVLYSVNCSYTEVEEVLRSFT